MTKIVSDYTTNLADELEISKTKRKEHMHDMQNVGIELTKLSEMRLAKFELPSGLMDAIALAKKIKSNGALRRQYQYIGKLMRSVDLEYVRNKLAEVNGDSVAAVRKLHLCESWRDSILNDSNKFSEFIAAYPTCNQMELKKLILDAKSDIKAKQIKSARELFKFIRDVVERNV